MKAHFTLPPDAEIKKLAETRQAQNYANFRRGLSVGLSMFSKVIITRYLPAIQQAKTKPQMRAASDALAEFCEKQLTAFADQPTFPEKADEAMKNLVSILAADDTAEKTENETEKE